MSNSNNKGNNIMVPNARQAMDQFKMEAASQVGVPRASHSYPIRRV